VDKPVLAVRNAITGSLLLSLERWMRRLTELRPSAEAFFLTLHPLRCSIFLIFFLFLSKKAAEAQRRSGIRRRKQYWVVPWLPLSWSD